MAKYSPLDDDEIVDIVLAKGPGGNYYLERCSRVNNIQIGLLMTELYDEFPFENVSDEDLGNKVALIENNWQGLLRFHILVDE